MPSYWIRDREIITPAFLDAVAFWFMGAALVAVRGGAGNEISRKLKLADPLRVVFLVVSQGLLTLPPTNIEADSPSKRVF